MSNADWLAGKKAFATERITVSTSAIGGTAATFNNVGEVSGASVNQVGGGRLRATGALVECFTNPVTYTVDGTTPVGGTTGHALAAGDTTLLVGYQAVNKFRAIRTGASDGALQITYYN